MSLDPHPSDAELLRRKAEREARGESQTIVIRKTPNVGKSGEPLTVIGYRGTVALGPNSPLHGAPRRKRSQMNDEEHQEQRAFMAWCREPAQLAAHPELWLFYAIPNFTIAIGPEHVRKAIGQRANDEGRRKGMLDTHLPVARGTWHSLYVEFKAQGGTPSKDQREWIDRLRAAGNRVEVLFTADAAKAIALQYLSLRRP